ncbi:hypothetical protein MMC29_001590 [Sticta canariensis]|nr:hypothetical protein [Sticta canariensis]
MDRSLENPQNHPPETDCLQAPRQQTSKLSLARFIIFCLHFLGCDIENISHVLEAYDVGDTIVDVASYIEQEKMVRFHQIPTPQGDQSTYTSRSSGTIVTIKYAQGRPERLEVKGPRDLTSSPRGVVTAVTSDGKKIITMAAGRRFRCRAGGRVDSVNSSGLGSLAPQ